jgi:pyruvate formate lyase activating enzyme
MRIGFIQHTTLIDFPGKIACTVFTQGCNFRCGYCHNPELVQKNLWEKRIPTKEFFDFITAKKNKLQGVCITGGEPTIQKDLYNFIKKIKQHNLQVKLDTQGSQPEVLRKLLNADLLDYIAMDIKGPLESYYEISNTKISPAKIRDSIELVMNSGLPYEFRTTVVKDQLKLEDFHKIGELIAGASLYYLQKFVPTKANDPTFLTRETYSHREFEKIRKLMRNYVKKCKVR